MCLTPAENPREEEGSRERRLVPKPDYLYADWVPHWDLVAHDLHTLRSCCHLPSP